MKVTKFILFTLVILTLQGCNSFKGRSDLESMAEVFQKHNPDKYEKVLYSFIEHARADDIDAMLALTSKVTIEKKGIESLKTYYLEDTIPFIKRCVSFSKGGDISHVTEYQSGTGGGWIFKKICLYDETKTINIRFVILKEENRIVVASLDLA